jgi:hypothetical protein
MQNVYKYKLLSHHKPHDSNPYVTYLCSRNMFNHISEEEDIDRLWLVFGSQFSTQQNEFS